MKLDPRTLLLACAVLILCGCDQPPANRANTPATSVPFGSLPEPVNDLRSRLAAPGVDGLTTHFVGSDDDELLLLEIDPAKFHPLLIGLPRTGTSAEEALRDNRLALVLGSGFVAELHGLNPVGLLQVEGRTLEDFFEASQWQCDDVVNLAGDRQAVLALATGDQTVIYHGDPRTYKASLLGFRPRLN